MSKTIMIRVGAGAAALVAAAAGFLATAPNAVAASTPTVRHIQLVGTAAYQPRPAGSADPAALDTEIPQAFGPEAQEGGGVVAGRVRAQRRHNRSMTRGQGAAAGRAGANIASSDRPPRSSPTSSCATGPSC